MNIGLTLAGAAISLAVLYSNIRTWKNADWEPKQIGPFATYFALGALSTVCTGGILGFLAGCSVQAANGAGARAVPGATGTQGGSIAAGSMGQLTVEGGAVVFVFTVALVLAWKAASKTVKKRMFGGAFCGATLCATAGVAGLLTGLPQLANGIGIAAAAALGGEGVL
ncbi:hypothetical protein ACFV1H_17775 [Streptomyces virginiae]|uniref:hypothetical protein n=1 Tax=Streptomyces virginiae TaxID=1961 RepID=UPI0036C22C8A